MATNQERVIVNRNPSLASNIPAATWIPVELIGNGSTLIPASGREGLIVWNPTAGGLSFTVNHAPNSQGRIMVSAVQGTRRTIAAGAYYFFGPFPVEGFMLANGMLQVYASAAGLLLAVLDIPTNFFVVT